MMRFDPHDPKYWDSQEMSKEFTRVVDICNGCRLCDNLCPPFVDLFDRIDAEDDKLTAAGLGSNNPVMELKPADYKHTVDTCYQCKLCYPKCPYTPPHEYQLDFPRLLLRAQAIDVKENKKSLRHTLRDIFTGNADRTATIASSFNALFNWANHNSMIRSVMQMTIGVAKKKLLPHYYKRRFKDRVKSIVSQPTEVSIEKVALFYTCLIDNNKPWVGEQFVEILQAHNISITIPEQECCGMPELGTGELKNVYSKVDRNVKRLAPLAEAGYKIIAMSPSCSMMLKLEYPLYASDKEAAAKIATATLDPMEYLMQLNRRKVLKTDFPAAEPMKVSYHVPCHLKVQNIGFQSRDLLKLIPGSEVTTIQQCSGHDGSWSMKEEYYEISLDVGRKLFKAIDKNKPDAIVASDCSLAHLHITGGTGEAALHPIEIVYKAMGLTAHLQHQ
ncbi:MAG TPA: heterodisulfide reductase-related iron-sulfur binding cluster [Candidatus Kapabacteria bacterium]|nr:heterodisulfide reductase-related iron-sulfur binding cluster [Candidatus Kapabacteria bacterium]